MESATGKEALGRERSRLLRAKGWVPNDRSGLVASFLARLTRAWSLPAKNSTRSCIRRPGRP